MWRLFEGVPIVVSAGVEQAFKITPAQLAAAITPRTKLILFNSPNNPSGSVYSREELTALAEVIQQHDNLYVLSDEIYEYINFVGEHVSLATVPGMFERTVTINGFSKGFAMTGWRLGYLGAPQSIRNAIVKVQTQFSSPAAFIQKAGKAALQGDRSDVTAMVQSYHKRRDLVMDLMAEIPGFELTKPEGAFYVFPNVSHYYGARWHAGIIKDSADFSALHTTRSQGWHCQWWLIWQRQLHSPLIRFIRANFNAGCQTNYRSIGSTELN